MGTCSSLFESDDPEDVEMLDGSADGLTSQAEEEEKRRKRNGTTFQVILMNTVKIWSLDTQIAETFDYQTILC